MTDEQRRGLAIIYHYHGYCRQYSTEYIIGLMKEGADLSVKDIKGQTVFYHVFENTPDKDHEVLNALIEYGADLEMMDDKEQKTPLMWAAFCERRQHMEVLLKAGANVNAVSPKDNTTALMEAVMMSSPRAVKLLLQHGADVFIRNDDGQDALSIAQEWGVEKEIKDMLVHAQKTSRAAHKKQIQVCKEKMFKKVKKGTSQPIPRKKFGGFKPK